MINLPGEIRIENLALSWEGKRLCTTEPLLETRRKLPSIERHTDTLYVLCSPLFGAGLEDVIAWLPHNSVLTCVELCQGLGTVLLTREEWGFPRLPVHPDFHVPEIFRTLATSSLPLPLPDILDDYENELSRFFARGLRRVAMISFHGGRRLLADGYLGLETRLNASLQRFWRNQSTILHLGNAWIRNSYCNLPLLSRSSRLPQVPGQTLVLAGAGPSLDASMEFLKNQRNSFMLMTVDTALPCLLHRGIKPDFVVVLESQQANLRDFIACDLSGIHVLADLSAHLGFLPRRGYGGDSPASPCMSPLSFFASRFWPCAWWEFLDALLKTGQTELPFIPPLGSVGLAALKLAGLMNPARILVAGLDFACQGGKSHARGSPALQSALFSHDRFRGFPVTGLGEKERPVDSMTVYATPLYTTDVLESYRNDSNILIQDMKNQGMDIFDLRPWGMKLDITPFDVPTGACEQASRPQSQGAGLSGLFAEATKNEWDGILGKLLDRHVSDLDSLVALLDQTIAEAGRDRKSGLVTESDTLPSGIQRALEGMDQFLLRIPPHRRKSAGFLVQARLELWYFKRLLGKIQLRLEAKTPG